jgi:hypothetical protein
VQHALLRGIEVVYQLEEGEVLGEPLPTRDERRAILLYEASEGGAGVLGQLISDPKGLGKVAREALSLMHFDNIGEAIAAGNPELLEEHGEQACVRGCYRCLLSYYNQPDHELIDRTSIAAQQMLIDLARGEIVHAPARTASAEESGWEETFKAAGIPLPDTNPITFGDQEMPFAWRGHYVAAATTDIDAATLTAAENKGWTLFKLPATPSDGLPGQMIATFRD